MSWTSRHVAEGTAVPYRPTCGARRGAPGAEPQGGAPGLIVRGGGGGTTPGVGAGAPGFLWIGARGVDSKETPGRVSVIFVRGTGSLLSVSGTPLRDESPDSCRSGTAGDGSSGPAEVGLPEEAACSMSSFPRMGSPIGNPNVDQKSIWNRKGCLAGFEGVFG